MAADWGDDGPPLSRALVQRVFCYFVPYWRRCPTLLAFIRVAAGVWPVSETVFGLVSDVITVLSTLALMVLLDWRLTLAALVLMPIVLVPTRFVGKATYRARKQTQEQLSQISSYMQEVLGISGILLVKAFTKERAERQRFQDINRELRRLEIRETMIGRWFGLLNQVFFTLGP